MMPRLPKPSITVVIAISVCALTAIIWLNERNRDSLYLGMDAGEAMSVLRKSGIDFTYVKEDQSSYILGISESEYKDLIENPPASPTCFMMVLVRFDEEGRLEGADVDINGRRVSINPLVIDEELEVQ